MDQKKSNDIGPLPYVTSIDNKAMENRYFRSAVWTGELMQMTVMCIPVGGDIGAEMHDDVEQFIRVEAGSALVKIGKDKNSMNQSQCMYRGDGIFVPKGTWHNIYNMGEYPLKLSSIYSPVQHPKGTIHETKKDSEEAHE